MFGSSKADIAKASADAATAARDAAVARQQIGDHMIECASRYKALKGSVDDIASLIKRTVLGAVACLGILVYRYLQQKGTLP